MTAPLRLRSEVMGSRGLPLLWRWLDQQDLRQRRIQGEGSWMEMKLHAQYHEWDRKNATIEALVGRGGKHKLRLFTPHDRGLSQTPSRYFMDAFAKFAKVCLFFC